MGSGETEHNIDTLEWFRDIKTFEGDTWNVALNAGIKALKEQKLLHAKAAVCDAYRAWLAKPTRAMRKPINVAILKLTELEKQK